MPMREEEIKEAAKLLGRRGGLKTVQTYGTVQMREWGKLGAKYGKLGGRPKGSGKKTKKER